MKIKQFFLMAVVGLMAASLTSCNHDLSDHFGVSDNPTTGVTEVTVDLSGIADQYLNDEKTQLKLAVGDQVTLSFNIQPAEFADTEVTLTPEDNEIVSIDGLKVKALKVGTTTVKAQAGSKTCVVTVVVVNPLATPLTIEATTAGTINIANSQAITIKYSKDGGVTKTESSATSIAIEVAAGDKVQLYGTTATGSGSSIGKCVKITGSGDGFKCTVYGNIMSLLSETGFDENTTLPAISTFRALFKGNTTLTDASKLLLPATTLTNACYENMFCGCTALTAAPELPATEGMSSGTCYSSMFEGCSSLTEAPSELPATTLGSNCYVAMFKDCISLTAAPQLKATTLADYCYQSMFQGCTSLATAPELPVETLKKDCYEAMFQGCTSLTTAPELPAPTLVEACYSTMFQGCTNLSSVTCLATSGFGESYCLNSWLYGVSSTGTFTKVDGITSWVTGSDGIPSGWTVNTVTP